MNNTLTAEQQATVEMAIGRIFRMGARPVLPGDEAEYDRCRNIVVDILRDDREDQRTYAPLPGWNFGAGNSGCIE